MKSILTILSIFISAICIAQTEATTTLSTLLLDKEIPLNQKNKKTHSNYVNINVPSDFWEQFERVDAVFISAWTGSGTIGKSQFEKDIQKMEATFDASPVLYFAEKAPGFFTFPQKQAGFGSEIAIFEANSDTNCLKRYTKAKIAPRGLYSCMIERFVSTTPVNFFYRFALPKQYYSAGKYPNFNVLLRSSAKKDTVVLDTKIA